MNRWIIALVVAVAAMVATTALILDGRDPTESPSDTDSHQGVRVEDHAAILERLHAQGYDTSADSDHDRLPDVLENFVYGSDPQAFSTTGNGIPDGWFAMYGHDPTEVGVESRPAAVPPIGSMPAVYGDEWPAEYRWTLADAYQHGAPEGLGDTFWDNSIDPRQWRIADGALPTAWLVHHTPDQDVPGWNITDPSLGTRSFTDDGFTVRDNYEHNTDPHLEDTDGDGLIDPSEIQRYRTDPRRYSSGGTGIPDGWLVHHDLDPTDPTIGSQDLVGKGMTVAAVWEYNLARYGIVEALAGQGLDPTAMSERNDTVPDGWLLDHGLDPLLPEVTQTKSHCASDFPGVRNLTAGDGGIPDLCITVEQSYLHGRPADWDEGADGPWRGGLDPAVGDQDEDGLLDAVEIRGWMLARYVDVGPTSRPDWIHVRSDPLRADTDFDGLFDQEEHAGQAERNGTKYRFPISDPSNPDTAFSGMTDAEKVFAKVGDKVFDLHVVEADGSLRPVLDPTRRDTAGDHMADGQAMDFWLKAASEVSKGTPYNELYPGSNYVSHLEWINRLPWLSGDLDESGASMLLAPDGDVDGDGEKNIIDATASGDGLLNGWQTDPATLRFSDYRAPAHDRPRSPTDPANPDTDGDGLDDSWELRHGAWNSTLEVWDLDPTQYDSSGDGKSDAEGNLDGDIVLWHAFKGTVTADPWEYTNGLEFEAGTDPHDSDENQNGVTEGWVAFWATIYPQWIADLHAAESAGQAEEAAALREIVGEVVPTMDEIDALQATIADPHDETVGDRAKDTLHYFRFVISPDPSTDASRLDPEKDEAYIREPVSTEIRDETGTLTKRIGTIQGKHAHTFAGDQGWGLNPYLMDTDGDGLRDAWEVYYAGQCAARLDPVTPDGNGDADQDGLTNLQEHAIMGGTGAQEGDLSTNPCQEDTDLDGFSEGDEVILGLDPLDSTDAAAAASGSDSDGDGIEDQIEVLQQTSPHDPDTDRDGLADGKDRPPTASTQWLDAIAPSGETWAQEYAQLGIAHKPRPCNDDSSDGRACFFGEESRDGHAGVYDAIIPMVPDGWSVYYDLLNPADPQVRRDVQARYACNMPAWWEPSQLGPWWWGVEGDSQKTCTPDRDMDGLHDRNGEDPVPAASQSNHAASTDLQDLMADAAEGDLELVRTAQAWGECAGDPRPCFQQWTSQAPSLEALRHPTAIEDLDVHDLADGLMLKEQTFTVTGRLVLADCTSDCGFPNRAVVLRLTNAQEPLHYDIHARDPSGGVTLGVTFTDAQGGFTITGCLCAEVGTIEVPDGFTALGRSHTQATWNPYAADVPVGSEWTLGVHGYAGTATFWGDPDRDETTHPHYMEDAEGPLATSAAWAAFTDPIRIESATQITLEGGIPQSIAWGTDRELPLSWKITDASGGVVPFEETSITLSGPGISITETAFTQADGTASKTLSLGQRTGTWALSLDYPGNGQIGWQPSQTEDLAVTLQTPLSLAAPDGSMVIRLGEEAEFSATVRHALTGAPMAGIRVEAVLGTARQVATSDDGTGAASFSMTPSSKDLESITFHVRSTTAHAAASASQTIRVVAGSILQATVPAEAGLGAPITISGSLTLDDGTPIAGAIVHALLAGDPWVDMTTAPDGTFTGTPIVPQDAGIGVQPLLVVFDGTSDVDAAQRQMDVLFALESHLVVDPVKAGRGQEFHITGSLVSAHGVPLVGETVHVTLPWGKTLQTLARSGGQFDLATAVPAEHALGTFLVHVSYPGSDNRTFGAATTSADLVIKSASRIVFDPLSILHRGNNTITGRLVDLETGLGIADATLSATATAAEPMTTQTDEEGHFLLRLPIARTVPGGPIGLDLEFSGDDQYAPAKMNATGVLRVPTKVSLTAPAEWGRGTDHGLRVRLEDDRGVPLVGQNVTLAALGSQWNLTTDHKGEAADTLFVPTTAPLGQTTLRVWFDGEAAHDPTQVVHDATIKDGVRMSINGMPEEVLPGQQVMLRIHVEDLAGSPIQTSLVVRIDQVPGSLLVETDEQGWARVAFVVPEVSDEGLRVTVRFPGTDLLASRTESMQPKTGLALQEATTNNGSSWGLVAAGAAAVAVVVAVIAGVVLSRRRRPTAEILEDAYERISAGDPWTDAVLDAYSRLTRLVQDYGIYDETEQTSRAFVQTLVQAGFLDEHGAIRLVALFERARYADGSIREQDAADAQRVLKAVLRSVHRAESQPPRGGTPA